MRLRKIIFKKSSFFLRKKSIFKIFFCLNLCIFNLFCTGDIKKKTLFTELDTYVFCLRRRSRGGALSIKNLIDVNTKDAHTYFNFTRARLVM